MLAYNYTDKCIPLHLEGCGQAGLKQDVYKHKITRRCIEVESNYFNYKIFFSSNMQIITLLAFYLDTLNFFTHGNILKNV